MHVILNAHAMNAERIPYLLEHVKNDTPTHWRWSLCTKPGRPANIAYEAARRSMQWCRCLSAWSERELLAGACAGWMDSEVCWWTCGDDRETWPVWQMVDRLRIGLEHVYDFTGKHCPVGFAGTEGGVIVEAEPCSYVQCDEIRGPVMLERSWAASLLVRRGLSGEPHSASGAVCTGRSTPSYVVPVGVMPVVG